MNVQELKMKSRLTWKPGEGLSLLTSDLVGSCFLVENWAWKEIDDLANGGYICKKKISREKHPNVLLIGWWSVILICVIITSSKWSMDRIGASERHNQIFMLPIAVAVGILQASGGLFQPHTPCQPLSVQCTDSGKLIGISRSVQNTVLRSNFRLLSRCEVGWLIRLSCIWWSKCTRWFPSGIVCATDKDGMRRGREIARDPEEIP